MTAEDQRLRLAYLVADRRKALGMSKEAAARVAEISRITWRKVENGESVRDITYAAVDRALNWTSGSAEAALDGGTPRVQSDVVEADVILTDHEAGSVRLVGRLLEAIRAEYGEAVYSAAQAELERSQGEGGSQQNRQSAT